MTKAKKAAKTKAEMMCAMCEETAATVLVAVTTLQGELLDRQPFCRSCALASLGEMNIQLGEPADYAYTSRSAFRSLKLTAKERAVLQVVAAAAEENGRDFAVMSSVRRMLPKTSGQQLGGVLTQLQDKGLIEVHEPIEVNGGTRYAEMVTQITLDWQPVNLLLDTTGE